jgi:hypothetical protein
MRGPIGVGIEFIGIGMHAPTNAKLELKSFLQDEMRYLSMHG